MRAVLLFVAALLALPAQHALAWGQLARVESEGGASLPTSRPAPTAVAVPTGLYVVTDVYAGDVVTSTGATTIYSTTTNRQTPGTYARVVDVVATGETSRFDGASLNRRARLPDGRLVAGTYYEDFVLTAAGFVSVNIVFFQDDRDDRAGTAPLPPPPTSAPTAVPGPLRTSTPTATPAPTAAPRTAAPTRRAPSLSAGIALGPTAPTLAAIEVLRGRAVALWPRAFVDGAPVAVRSWRLVAGGADDVSALAAGGAEPCVATWLVLPPAGTAVTLRFEVATDAAPGRVLVAEIRVTVRSPALQW